MPPGPSPGPSPSAPMPPRAPAPAAPLAALLRWLMLSKSVGMVLISLNSRILRPMAFGFCRGWSGYGCVCVCACMRPRPVSSVERACDASRAMKVIKAQLGMGECLRGRPLDMSEPAPGWVWGWGIGGRGLGEAGARLVLHTLGRG